MRSDQHNIIIGNANNRDVSLNPLDISTKGVSILAIRGAGKSWLNAVIAEGLCEENYPFAIIDPMGEYFTLKARYDVLVIGGSHGDVPLYSELAEEIARILIEKKLKAILDLTSLKRRLQPEFVRNFCESLLDTGMMKKIPFWLSIEEAQRFVPQKGNASSKEIILDIAETGRHAGIGYSLVAHRAATLDKTALAQCDFRFFKRLNLPIDIRVVKEFLPSDNKSIAEKLPMLKENEALFYAPREKCLTIIKVKDRKTPHGGVTPTFEFEPITSEQLTHTTDELKEYFNSLISKVRREKSNKSNLIEKIRTLEKNVSEKEKEIERLKIAAHITKSINIEPSIKTPLIITSYENSKHVSRNTKDSVSLILHRNGSIDGPFWFIALMDKIPTTKIAIVKHLQTSKSAMSVQEISKKIQRSESITRRYLKELEKKKIAISKKIGRKKFYRIGENFNGN